MNPPKKASKRNAWKMVAFVGAAVIVIAGLLWVNSGVSKEPAAGSVNPAFGQYISSYTAGIVSSGSPIRIMLSQNPSDSVALGESSVKLFDFNPSVAGTMIWLDQRTVEFRPETRMQSGLVYEVEFYLSKLMTDVPSELKTFKYSFQVVPQNFELTINNVRPYVKTELKRQMIEGVLQTADFGEEMAVEQMLTATQDGKVLKIRWTHQSEGKEHQFVVEDVTRKEAASNVTLSVSGAPLGIEHGAQEQVEVPALGDFKVTNVRVEQGSNQSVVIQFSDPLNEGQNLQGLVSLTELPDLDFEIKDNEVRVFPPVRQTGSRTLTIEAGLRNVVNYKMSEGFTSDVVFEQLNPAVRFTGNGSILPASDGLVLPFEAVNLRSVEVQIVKIFENNVLQFFQVNEMDGNQELRRVGKRLVKKVISLENSGIADLGKWNRFTLDLATFINSEPGAIYQVSIGFKRQHAAFDCEGVEGDEADMNTIQEETWDAEPEESYWDSYEDYYYGDYDWEQRDNPCHSSYYTGQRTIRKNIVASDLGVIVKRGSSGATTIIITDLKTTLPLTGVLLELYDFQQQVIGTASTGADGRAVIDSRQQPFALVAKNGAQRGYLKLNDGQALSMSSFDVGGERVNKGMKGFLYGERGVWRPGDSLFLTFVLQDKLKLLPENHPVVFELENPQGQTTQRLVRSASENGFYDFATATSPDAVTGSWTGRIKVGGAEFTQPIRIETVKPNRLKINLDFGVEKLTAEQTDLAGKLNVKWLHGAPGKNLRAVFEVTLNKGITKFDKYEEYTFEDPSREFYSETQQVFDGYTDEQGNATVNVSIGAPGEAPGALEAVFRGKAFEESGDFSIDRFSIPYYPYTAYTGIRPPQGDAARGMLLTDTTHRVDIVTVDANGKPVSRDGIEVYLYKLDWRWWWDNSSGGSVNYMSGSYSQPLAQGTVRTVNGKGAWTFKVKYPEWGRFYIRAIDPQSGHSTGKIVYIDWPGWAGRARGESDGATMLSFSTDKSFYNIGEQVNLEIPGSADGRALISVENGSSVLNTFWLETQKGSNRFSFEVKEEMTPNVFVHVTLLQPHAQTANNLPIRMYGVMPVQVEDPKTHLVPEIEMPDVLEPGTEVTIKVSEKSNRRMTYTLAVVDEGLLDLTRFKTPELWKRFYAREALGVKTWDIYDQVIGAYGGKIERLLAVGGGDEGEKEDDAKANRFKPVVMFFGPVTLNGGSNEHTFIMPQYIGSVKTMLVAGYEGAYGSVEKATPVRKPLMVLATLPRVLGPEEKVKLPVTLFSMEPSIRNVKIEVKASGPLTVSGEASQTVAMEGSDMTVAFDLDVKSATGVGKIQVTATSGKFTSTDVIEIDVRNPNPSVTKVDEKVLEAGQTWTAQVNPAGVPGTNSAMLEVSSLPPVNLGQRLKYLMQYPYGCIEQTTSSVFPQLYLDAVKPLNDGEKALIQKNVRAGIERLKMFIRPDGGFAYWPGSEDTDAWGTTYAGHFLLEAEAKGYFVPNDMIRKWKKFQKNRAQQWRKHHEQYSSELIQAYRLYTLALAGDADLASMNRMRELAPLPMQAAWMLSAAYAKAGQPEVAKALINKLPVNVKPYQEMAWSYGSDERDKAIILETMVMLDERSKGFEVLREISAELSNPNSWMSTQSVAWCLKAVSAYAAKETKGDMKFTYTYDGQGTTAATGLPIAQATLKVEGVKQNALKVVNNGGGTLFVRVITEGIPARGTEEEASSNLSVVVGYMDVDGNTIDPSELEQGTQFIASVNVTNPGVRGAYKNMAINQIFPSGWEINNLRLDDAENRLSGDKPTYQDIRDDRVYTYFDIGPAQRRSFRVMLTATYAGTYYLPAVSCEAMYDRSVYARTKGQEVRVTRPVNP
jgi:uncharacterized protein YfaS (alpha-2-macroglobulin family)